MKKKIVLITGGAGFLGSHLCDKFIEEGFEVIALDNLLTGNINNISHLLKVKDFTFINHDITKKINISSDIDYILNFACPASPIDYLKLPIRTLEIGSIGSINCLNLAKDKNARILMASTSEVYGDPNVHPQHEEYYGNVNCIGPRSVYDEAKRFMESITIAYHNLHSLDTRIVRIFNTYGPRMRLNDGRALPAFFCQTLLNEDITIFGDGLQTRSFCYVDDLVEGIFKLLFSNYIYPVNIGNPEEISLIDFANEIKKITNSKSKITFHPLPKNDPLKRKPDISKAKRILNWEPKIDRTKGLIKTMSYFKLFTNEELRTKHLNFK